MFSDSNQNMGNPMPKSGRIKMYAVKMQSGSSSSSYTNTHRLRREPLETLSSRTLTVGVHYTSAELPKSFINNIDVAFSAGDEIYFMAGNATGTSGRVGFAQYTMVIEWDS